MSIIQIPTDFELVEMERMADHIIAAVIYLGLDDELAAASPDVWASVLQHAEADDPAERRAAYALGLSVLSATPSALHTLVDSLDAALYAILPADVAG